jgi:hypothetical protein
MNLEICDEETGGRMTKKVGYRHSHSSSPSSSPSSSSSSSSYSSSYSSAAAAAASSRSLAPLRQLVLCSDARAVYEFLGLSYDRWLAGFGDKEEIYEWLAQSPYVHPCM